MINIEHEKYFIKSYTIARLTMVRPPSDSGKLCNNFQTFRDRNKINLSNFLSPQYYEPYGLIILGGLRKIIELDFILSKKSLQIFTLVRTLVYKILHLVSLDVESSTL